MFVSHTSDASQLPSWDRRLLYERCTDNMLSTSTCLPWPYISWLTALRARILEKGHVSMQQLIASAMLFWHQKSATWCKQAAGLIEWYNILCVYLRLPGSFLFVALMRFVLISKEMLMMIRRPALLNVIPNTGKCICHGEGLTLGGCALCWRFCSISMKLPL